METKSSKTNKKTIILLIAALLSLCSIGAHANSKVSPINQYIEKGEKLNVTQEFNIGSNKDIKLNIKFITVEAQATKNNSDLNLSINGKKVGKKRLSQQLKPYSFKVPASTNVENIVISSDGAYVSSTLADLVSDQPQQDDLSIKFNRY